MEEFVSFRKFITPSIITIIFWIGVVLSVIGGLVMIVMGVTGSAPGMSVLIGLLYIVLGPLVVRIYCELVILGFKIYDTLTEIKNMQAGSGPAAPQAPPPSGL